MSAHFNRCSTIANKYKQIAEIFKVSSPWYKNCALFAGILYLFAVHFTKIHFYIMVIECVGIMCLLRFLYDKLCNIEMYYEIKTGYIVQFYYIFLNCNFIFHNEGYFSDKLLTLMISLINQAITEINI